MAMLEITGETFNHYLNAEPTRMEENSLVASREMTTSPKDKVVAFSKLRSLFQTGKTKS